MGIFRRRESKYWWLWLETAPRGQKREKTDVLVGRTKAQGRASRTLAEQVYYKRMGELATQAHGLPQAKATTTFGAFADWYRTHQLPAHRGATREGEILTRLARDFGRDDLRALTPDRVREWMTTRLATPTRVTKAKRTAARLVRASAATVNREVDVLKAVLQAAVPTYLPVSPLYGMKRLPSSPPRRQLLSPEAEAALLAQITKPDDRAIVLLGLDALLRLSSILALTVRDDRGAYLEIHRPKSGRPYVVPLSKRARKALDAVVATRDDWQPTDYLFARRRRAGTDRERRSGIRQMLARACAAANVPYGRNRGGITFHWATRRTGARRMLEAKIDPATVQRVGDWATADIVLEIYGEVSATDPAVRRAVEVPGRAARKRKAS